MNTRAQSLRAWRTARSRIDSAGGTITILKNGLFPHPRDAGACLTSTWSVGQLADYVLEFGLGTAPLLIREFDDRYEAFVAGIQLTEQAIRLVQSNPTAALYLGGALVGASIGTAMTRTREGAVLGAGIGLLLAVLLQSRIDANAGRIKDASPRATY